MPRAAGNVLPGVTEVVCGKRTRRHAAWQMIRCLFQLRFLENDMFADDGIVLFEFDLFRQLPRILLPEIVVAGLCSADQLD